MIDGEIIRRFYRAVDRNVHLENTALFSPAAKNPGIVDQLRRFPGPARRDGRQDKPICRCRPPGNLLRTVVNSAKQRY